MQKTVSDTELQSFAKAYVKVEEIEEVQKAFLRHVQDPAQVQQLQQEATVKMVNAVEQQGLTPESYNQILTTVSSDEALAQKAFELIEQEQTR